MRISHSNARVPPTYGATIVNTLPEKTGNTTINCGEGTESIKGWNGKALKISVLA